MQIPTFQGRAQPGHQAVLLHHAKQLAIAIHHGQVAAALGLHGHGSIHQGGARVYGGDGAVHHV